MSPDDQVDPNESRRIARLLAIPEALELNELSLAAAVAEGLPVDAVSCLESLLDARLVPPRTLARYKSSGQPLPRDISNRIYLIATVVDNASRQYQDARIMRLFLKEPHQLLNNSTPLELASSSAAGARAVLNLLERASAGFSV